ncbi:hypothetical protein BDN70DRAFT_954639 [Pholiota conissans]|uniref:F-box domain-containing protein n=1 Tax=Pholiota conissans TaxID=109636 RepID=A0A9P6CR38_9AGAR|nr:hypothetical protein BDN70DRAFT_954639 [Pholiota conissans]
MDDSSISINSLPDELLVQIHEAAIEPKKCVYPLEFPDYATFSSISRVCKRWRQVILDNGPLWAASINVDRDTVTWAQEVLHRAKDSPLFIHSQMPYADSPDDDEKNKYTHVQNFASATWQFVLKNSHRWAVFDLGADIFSHSADALTKGLMQPAPELRKFTVTNKHNPGDYMLEFPSESFEDTFRHHQYVLPEKLFGGYSPQLEAVSISKVYLPASFDFSLWSNLAILFVEQKMDTCPVYLTQNWFEILRSLTQLEQLRLVGTFNAADEELPDSSFFRIPDIHLDRLFDLSLSTGSEKHIMFDLFAKLVVPHTCKIVVEIQFSDFYDDLDGWEPYPSLAFSRLQLGINRHFGELFADLDDPADMLEVNLWNKSAEGTSFGFEINDTTHRSGDFVFLQFIEGERPPKAPMPISRAEKETLESVKSSGYSHYPFSNMLAVLEDLPLKTIKIAVLPQIVAEDIDPLHRLLSRCDNLETLLCVDTDSIIFDILQRKKSSEDGVILPKLDYIHFLPLCLQDFQRMKGWGMWRSRETGKPADLCIDVPDDQFMSTTEALIYRWWKKKEDLRKCIDRLALHFEKNS